MSVPIWLDCDPGHDDVLAIFLAAQRAELVGITVVSGNAPLNLTERNALVACEVAGIDVPVHVGADRPLLRPAVHAAHIHGASGLDGPELPKLTRVASAVPAVRALLAAAEARDDLWLIATGPLTNVALALATEPGLAERLRGISLMGGAFGPGNSTAVAEFNIWADPDAAEMVFASGAKLIMAGLDLTHQFIMDRPRIELLRALGGRTAVFSAELLDFFALAYQRTFAGEPGGPLHDPCSILAVTDPQLFTSEERHVVVETGGVYTRGMTVVDRRTGNRSQPANCEVLTTIDDATAFELLADALRELP